MKDEYKLRVQSSLSCPHVIAFLATILAIMASFLLIPAFSPSNDDAYIEQSLAGTGGVSAYPTPYTTTVNIVLSTFVSLLYRSFSFIRWWPLLQFIFIFLSFSALGSTLIALERSKNIFPKFFGSYRLVLEIFSLVMIELGLTGALISRLQFTSTASLLISVSIFISCVKKSEVKENRRSLLTTILLPIILAIVGFAYRSQSGYLGLFFWMLAALWTVFSTLGDNKKRKSFQMYLVPVLVVGVLSCAIYIVDYAAINLSPNPISNTYSGFSKLVDYPRPSFSENPELYEAAGWDEPLTALVGKWFMMDERVNANSLEAINSANKDYALASLYKDPIEALTDRLQEFIQPVTMAYFTIFILLSANNLTCIKRNICGFIAALLAVTPLIFLVYLIFQGRLIERSAIAILLPAISANAVVFIRNVYSRQINFKSGLTSLIAFIFSGMLLLPLAVLSSSNLSKAIAALPIVYLVGSFLKELLDVNLNKKRLIKSLSLILKNGLCTMCILSAILPMIAAIRIYGWNSSIAAKHFYQLSNTRDFFSYVDEHPNTVYIYSDAQITMQYLGLVDWPNNQTGWGGWRYSYSWFDDAMKEVGLDGKPTSDDFLRNNVRFVSSSEETSNLLLQYMQNKYGSSIEMRQTDSITDEIKVYKFTYTEN